MARTRAPDHESQREQILDLAAAKFAQTSYPSTSMTDLANASGTSKARLYHYYEGKEAILFDLLDRYTKRLMLIIAEVEGASQRRGLTEREAFAELVRAFLAEYETSHNRHVALLNDVKYLEDTQRQIVLDRQRDIVAAFARQLARVSGTNLERQPDARDDDGVRDDQLDLHVAEARRPPRLSRFRRAGDRHDRARARRLNHPIYCRAASVASA